MNSLTITVATTATPIIIPTTISISLIVPCPVSPIFCYFSLTDVIFIVYKVENYELEKLHYNSKLISNRGSFSTHLSIHLAQYHSTSLPSPRSYFNILVGISPQYVQVPPRYFFMISEFIFC